MSSPAKKGRRRSGHPLAGGLVGGDSGAGREAAEGYGAGRAAGGDSGAGREAAEGYGAGRAAGDGSGAGREAGEGYGAAGRSVGGRAAGRSSVDSDPEAAARNICLRLLTGAPRTRAQLADALRRKGVPDEAAEAVLGRFADTGLINDEAFAEAWVESRHLGRGLARRALAQELRQRGVGEETVREAVQRVDHDREVETARALVEKRLPATRSQEAVTRMRRLAGMLARKGYPASVAYRVVREALEAEGEDVQEGWAESESAEFD